MPCGFMKAKKKIQQFMKQPKVMPIRPTVMTQPEIDYWVKDMEHAMDESLSDPVERAKVREKMKKVLTIQAKTPGAGYNPGAMRIERLEPEQKTMRDERG